MAKTKREKVLEERQEDVRKGGAGARKTGIWKPGKAPGDARRMGREKKLQRAAQGEFGPDAKAQAIQYIEDRTQDPSSPFYDPEEARRIFERKKFGGIN